MENVGAYHYLRNVWKKRDLLGHSIEFKIAVTSNLNLVSVTGRIFMSMPSTPNSEFFSIWSILDKGKYA